MNTFLVWCLVWVICFRTRKSRKIIHDFMLLGGDKKKMITRIKELHLLNDGSYKSSNANVWLKTPYGHFRIKHQHGYVTVSYYFKDNLQWRYYLTEAVLLKVDEMIYYREEAEYILGSKRGKHSDDFGFFE